GRHRGRIPERELAFMQLHLGAAMRRHGYEPEPVRLSVAGRARFVAFDWPNQAARMVTWQAVEGLQQRFPRLVPRRPGSRMRVEPAPAPELTGGAA
ncbi:MAG: hypothetical protein ACM3OO_11870, partial [Planctomycetaceae bacterium]